MNKLSLQIEMQEKKPQADALKQAWTAPTLKIVPSQDTLSSGTAGSEGGGRPSYTS